MPKRFVSIWFRYLLTDWFSRRQPKLRTIPFVLRTLSHGRMIITATNAEAERKDITTGMALADARATVPDIQVLDHRDELAEKLLKQIAEWFIRYTPVAAVDLPDGIILDATGCAHLWGGEEAYLDNITRKLNSHGYSVRTAMADTIGTSWAVARYSTSVSAKKGLIVESGRHYEALLDLPPEALRLEDDVNARLHKLGLHRIRQFIRMPLASLRRRFGSHFIRQLEYAVGKEDEPITAVDPPSPYMERLPCMEPIVTATGISIALERLLISLCARLQQEQKGLRSAIFKGYRVDGKSVQIEIGTHRPTHHVSHLIKLFEPKIQTIEPALGIDLFVLEAPKVEDHHAQQEKMWETAGGFGDVRLSELIDRLAVRTGFQTIHRYLPDEHYWPERSIKLADSIHDIQTTPWRNDLQRPLQLLEPPEFVEVTAPIPDYPPMLFIHRGKIHKIVRADGPERIEQEWWLQQGQHRDYYRVEDEEGQRYWLFRLGHYDDEKFQWFIHGFFA